MKEEAHGEEWDYVAGRCKLNYLNVLTVIISKEREERDSREGKNQPIGCECLGFRYTFFFQPSVYQNSP